MSIRLPKPSYRGKKSLEECIIERESIRKYDKRDLDLVTISQLFWATQGKKGYKRTVPSAGAIYPLELYAIIKDKGLYHYNIKVHSLDLLIEADFSKKLAKASWNQVFIGDAPLNVVICANYSKIQQRYGYERGLRYSLIEVGHCAQNLHLQAVALGLVSVPIGAFKDEEVRMLLVIPEYLDPLYIIPVGYPK